MKLIKLKCLLPTLCICLGVLAANPGQALVAGGGPWLGSGTWRAEYMFNITYMVDQGQHVSLWAANGGTGTGGWVWLNKSDADQCQQKLYRAYTEKVNHCNTTIAVNVYGFGSFHDAIYEVDPYQCGLYNDSTTNFCAVNGCTDSNAVNYNSAANTNDGSCSYTYAVNGSTTGTRCQIALLSCPNHPSFGGTFNDSYGGAKSDQARCLTRANDYFSYCGGNDPVTATYYSGGSAAAHRTIGDTSNANASSGASSSAASSASADTIPDDSEDDDSIDSAGSCQSFENHIQIVN